MEISERMLRGIFLPPWEAGIKKNGALGVMATYPAIDGVPVHGSEWILTDILRKEFGFEGLVLSEGGGIGTLVYEGLAATQKEAGQLALRAGVDVGISYESGYMLDMLDSVREGKVPPWRSSTGPSAASSSRSSGSASSKGPASTRRKPNRTVHCEAHQDLALEAARKAIVLLKNENGLLPLRKDIGSIAVIGPNADHARNQLGDYVSLTVLQDVTTILEGIRAAGPAGDEGHIRQGLRRHRHGRQRDREGPTGGGRRRRRGGRGRRERMAEPPTGKGRAARATTRRPSSSRAFRTTSSGRSSGPARRRSSSSSTGGRSPSGRSPRASRPSSRPGFPARRADRRWPRSCSAPSIPSGKLSVTVPRHAGQLPAYYDAKKSKEYWIKEGWGHPYADLEPTPLYPFGHGLSYTTFAYGKLRPERRRDRSRRSDRRPRGSPEFRGASRRRGRPALYPGRHQLRRHCRSWRSRDSPGSGSSRGRRGQ